MTLSSVIRGRTRSYAFAPWDKASRLGCRISLGLVSLEWLFTGQAPRTHLNKTSEAFRIAI